MRVKYFVLLTIRFVDKCLLAVQCSNVVVVVGSLIQFVVSLVHALTFSLFVYYTIGFAPEFLR